MSDYVKRADQLQAEATDLLRDSGLLTILEDHGAVHITGSFSYHVMTWRDIDICLEVERVDLPAFFQLGREIAALRHVGSMYYRNEFVLSTPGNPTGLFWCIDFALPAGTQWKVDVLVSTANHVRPIVSEGVELKERLTPGMREAVLEIKGVLSQRPEYRRQFRSSDIYSAVLDHGVRSVEEWHDWWKASASPDGFATPAR